MTDSLELKYTVRMGLTNNYFLCFLCLKGIFLKGMGEKLPLFEDERLSPSTRKVMAINVIHKYPHF